VEAWLRRGLEAGEAVKVSWTTWGPLTESPPLGALYAVAVLMVLCLAWFMVTSHLRRGDNPRKQVNGETLHCVPPVPRGRCQEWPIDLNTVYASPEEDEP
jgi:hypothetical protein